MLELAYRRFKRIAEWDALRVHDPTRTHLDLHGLSAVDKISYSRLENLVLISPVLLTDTELMNEYRIHWRLLDEAETVARALIPQILLCTFDRDDPRVPRHPWWSHVLSYNLYDTPDEEKIFSGRWLMERLLEYVKAQQLNLNLILKVKVLYPAERTRLNIRQIRLQEAITTALNLDLLDQNDPDFYIERVGLLDTPEIRALIPPLIAEIQRATADRVRQRQEEAERASLEAAEREAEVEAACARADALPAEDEDGEYDWRDADEDGEYDWRDADEDGASAPVVDVVAEPP